MFALLFVLCYQPILKGVAGYLAPSEEGKAELVILEGVQVVRQGAVAAGKELIFKGQADRLIVVLHQMPKEEQLFALPSNYPQLVQNEMERAGLKRDQFLVMAVPIIHPITLTEAKYVLAELGRLKVRRAILSSEGFHTRRSYWVYRQEGEKYGIQIIPRPHYISYQQENWWQNTEGVRAFVTEYLKLGYYFLKGYISVRGVKHEETKR